METKVRKGEFRFYLNRPGDGKYIFKVLSEADREDWISKLQRVITVSELWELRRCYEKKAKYIEERMAAYSTPFWQNACNRTCPS